MWQRVYEALAFLLGHARTVTQILVANGFVSLSTFVVFAFAPYAMSVESFALLSLLTSANVVTAAVLDFGLNITAVAKFSAMRNMDFLRGLVSVKAVFVGLAALLLPFAVLGDGLTFWILVVLCASMVNFWTGLRACDQAQEDFNSYTAGNLQLAALRMLAGLLALASGKWILIALAVYVVPAGLIAAMHWNKWAALLSWPRLGVFRDVIAYSKIVFLSGTCFLLIPYLPQWVAYERLTALEVSTYGIVLIYLGPLVLLNASLRSYLLPNVCRAGDVRPGRAGSISLVCGGLLLAAGLLAVAAGLSAVYGQRFPELASSYATLAMLHTASCLLGLLNLRVYAIGAIRTEAAVNVARVAFLAVGLWAFGRTLFGIVLITGLVMLIGEACLFLLVRRGARR